MDQATIEEYAKEMQVSVEIAQMIINREMILISTFVVGKEEKLKNIAMLIDTKHINEVYDIHVKRIKHELDKVLSE